MVEDMSDDELIFSTFSNFPECSLIQELNFSDRCSFSRTDEDCIERAYVFNYIQFLYCYLRPYNNFTLFLGVVVLLIITLIMFLILGITADKVFCPALQVLSVELGMNENLAGVTVLAFGNGSPDLFTSLAAIDEPAKMMFSDLFGGAIYVHGVIGALICILSPFHLNAGNVSRDYGFLMLSVLHIDYCMSDGVVTVWEAVGILMVYGVYLAIVIADQLLLKQYVKFMEKKLANTSDLRGKQYDQMKELRTEAKIEVLSRNHMTKGEPQKTHKRSTINIEKSRLSSYNVMSEPNDNLWRQMWQTLNPIDRDEWHKSSIWGKIYICIRAPIDLAINLVIPIVDYELDRHGWSKLLNCLQIVGMPIFVLVAAQLEPESTTVISCVVVTVFTVPIGIYTFCVSRTDYPPRFHCLLAVYSSIGAMFFIYVAASETVNILVVMGLITGSSNPFLGVTLLAWGNGIGDLVANMSLAASGYQKMAYAACLGGPFFTAAEFDWNKSFSAPDLSGPLKGLDRFLIKHPHEYISVDDLKYFRRKKPSAGLHTKSQICLHDSDEPELPFASLRSEYRKSFQGHDCRGRRAPLLRRATSLHLEGLMHHITENQDKYHWYTPQDLELSRSYPVRYPESIRLGPEDNMAGEYRSSYVTHPMVDRTMKILPREAFTIKPEPVQPRLEPTVAEKAASSKLAEDKFKRDVAARENAKCHLQQRAGDSTYNSTPSEYTRQYVPFPIREKAHSIPQLSHIKMAGNFDGVPEYREKFCMYPNYSKSAPIKKIDNLRMSGSEGPPSGLEGDHPDMPEYKEKYRDPPGDLPREKPLKTDDHLHPQGKFSRDLPEYYESFRDPQVRELPERGKCREPYLRLNGKLEFNPEYGNTYLDFPRSRPVVTKPTSSLRLPISSQASHEAPSASSCSLQGPALITDPGLTSTPEYRRAQYNYQIRERTPPPAGRKGSDSTTPPSHATNRRRSMRNRQATSMLDHSVVPGQSSNPEYFSAESGKKPVRFGRRASVLHNATHCRGKSSIIEGNPKYASSDRRPLHMDSERGSFVVLNDPRKKPNWTKKTWFDA